MGSSSDDWKPVPTYVPKTWKATAEGPGRAVTLQSPLGVDACRLYTDDRDVLWYVQTGEHREAVQLAQTLVSALMGAKYANAMASDVFDHWAGYAGPIVFAGTIETGELSTLLPSPPQGP